MGRANVPKVKAGIDAVLTALAAAENTTVANLNGDSTEILEHAKSKVHAASSPYGALNSALTEFSFDGSKDPTGEARLAFEYTTSPDTRFVLADIPASDSALLSDYDSVVLPLVSTSAVSGNAAGVRNQFEAMVKCQRWVFAAGFRRQMVQILQYARNVGSTTRFPQLASVEVTFGGGLHCDYTTYDSLPDLQARCATIRECKNWTSFAQTERDDPTEAARLLTSLSTQLRNYMGQASYRGVMVEWVGTIPASIQSAVTSVGARFPGKLCQIVSV